MGEQEAEPRPGERRVDAPVAVAADDWRADPAASIGKALKPITKKGKQPEVQTIEAAREVLRTMEDTTSGPLTKLASRCWL
jgi:hypothetical protein